MIEFITGASGTGKTTLMFSRIKELSEAGKNLCILVPEQYSHEFDKNLYFFLGAEKFNELFSLSFTSLARQIFQLFGEPGNKNGCADEMSRMIIAFLAVDCAQKQPGYLSFFQKQCSQNGFADEVLKLISDMKRSGITPQKLLSRADKLDNKLKDKTADISNIYYEYERLLEEYGFRDELDNVREAAKTAALHDHFKGTTVFLDEFESFTGDQLDMLKVIISSAENVIFTLRTDNVNDGEFTLFETVNATYRDLARICRELHKDIRITPCDKPYRFKSPDLEYLSTHALRNFKPDPDSAPDIKNIHILEAKDMYSEAEYVCASIRHLLFDDRSLKYRDIAVISNSIEQYADVLKAALKRYDIPAFMSIERAVSHTSVMMFFSTLLELISSGRFRSETIFRFLKCGILKYSLTDTARLENYCYKWNIDEKMWTSPFTAPDDELESIEAMRKDIISPLSRLKKELSGSVEADKACRLIYKYIVNCKAEESIAEMMTSLIKADRDYEASELKRLWGCLIDILDSTAETLGSETLSAAELSRLLRSMTSRLKYSLPPQTLDAVTVASARTARLNSPKMIFVMGACEGDFPNQVSLHGLFSETDKQKLSLNGIDLSRPLSDLIASERLIVYKALSTASHKLFISYPLSDLSGQAKYPAPVIDQIKTMFGSSSMLITDDQIPPDFYAVTLHSAYYHYMQERKNSSVSAASIGKVLLNDNVYHRKIAGVLARSGMSGDLTVSTDIMKKLKSFEPLYLSSTGVENYNTCHFMYFCKSCLNLFSREKIDLDARAAGNISHNCFFNIMRSRSKKEFINMSYDDLKQEIRSETEKYCDAELAGDFGKNPSFRLELDKLTERLSDVFLYTQHALMASDFEPKEYELKLRDSHSVKLKFNDSNYLSFGGIIDRVDTYENNGKKYVRIIDYKSSKKFITAETLASGINLQMLLYLFASTDKGGKYEGFIPSGVLYSPVQITSVEVENSRNDSVNTANISSNLKNRGIVLNAPDVFKAMEHDCQGRFVPVKLNADGSLYKYSSCITGEGMELLKQLAFDNLKDMARSLYSGNAQALPLKTGQDPPCVYCEYGDICGNSDGNVFRVPDPDLLRKAADILSMKENIDNKEDK